MKVATVAFFGHRKVAQKSELKIRIYKTVENLIINQKAVRFLFGSKSEYDDLCYEVVTELKKKYNYIERIYVRAEFPYINNNYRNYLLARYEDTYYPETAENAGKAAYIERNYEMIDNSDICVVYYDKSYLPQKRRSSRRALSEYQPKSGTKIAYDYAIKKGKMVLNTFVT